MLAWVGKRELIMTFTPWYVHFVGAQNVKLEIEIADAHILLILSVFYMLRASTSSIT